MASTQFVSARVPSNMLKKLEARAEETGTSKSKILVDALDLYLNPPGEDDLLDGSYKQKITALEAFKNYTSRMLESLEPKVDNCKLKLDALDKRTFHELESVKSKIEELERDRETL